MGVLAARNQELSVRSNDDGQGSWGPIQIATPAIVGGVLIILFVAYIVWQRRKATTRPYDYQPVKSGWGSTVAQMFGQRARRQVLHSSKPITLDDSMKTPSITVDFRLSRQHRSSSSDSQTPLTGSTFAFGYPPEPEISESPPPISAQRHPWRWWKILGMGPKEVRPKEPTSRWRVDDQDASSSGHGSYQGHERTVRYVSGLDVVDENQEEIEVEAAPSSVLHIGDNFTTVSTPITERVPDRMVRVFSPVPEMPEVSGSSGVATLTIPTNSTQTQTTRASPAPTRSGLPPSYHLAQGHTRYPSAEDLGRQSPRLEPHMLFPPPVRAAGYGTSHMFHARQNSSDTFLPQLQSPMATPSIY